METEYRDRKEQIVATALRILSGQGMKGLTMKNLAAEIGFTDAALYRHFSNKHDILKALIERVGGGLIDKTRQVAGAIGDPMQKLHAILQLHLTHCAQNRGIRLVVFSEEVQQNDAELRSLLYGIINRYLDLIRGILLQARGSGQIRAELDVEAASIAFFGLVQGVTFLGSLSEQAFPVAEKTEALFRCYVEGVAPGGSPMEG